MSRHQEAFPAALVTEIAQLVLTRPPRAGRTRVLAIDGRSGSGKTTLSNQITEIIGDDADRLRMDDIYPGWNGLLSAVHMLVGGVLQPLTVGRPARTRRWSWVHDDWTSSYREVPAGRVLIVEGVGSGALACSPYLSALIWVEAPEKIRYQRAMRRDGESYRPHWQRWADQEEEYLRSDDPATRADLVIADL